MESPSEEPGTSGIDLWEPGIDVWEPGIDLWELPNQGKQGNRGVWVPSFRVKLVTFQPFGVWVPQDPILGVPLDSDCFHALGAPQTVVSPVSSSSEGDSTGSRYLREGYPRPQRGVPRSSEVPQIGRSGAPVWRLLVTWNRPFLELWKHWIPRSGRSGWCFSV